MKGKPWFIKLLKLSLTKSLTPRMAAPPEGWKAQEPSWPSSCWLERAVLSSSTFMTLIPWQVGVREAPRPSGTQFSVPVILNTINCIPGGSLFLINNFSKLETSSLLQWIMLKPSRFRALFGKISWNKSFCLAGTVGDTTSAIFYLV